MGQGYLFPAACLAESQRKSLRGEFRAPAHEDCEVPGGAAVAAETGETSLPVALSSVQSCHSQERHQNTESPHGWGREGLVKGSSPTPCPGQGCSQWYRRLLKAVSALSFSKNQLWELVPVSYTPTRILFPSVYLDFSMAQFIPLSLVLLLCFPDRHQSLPSPSTGHLSLFLPKVTKSNSFSLSQYIRGNVLMILSNVTCLSRNLESIEQLKPENPELYEFL